MANDNPSPETRFKPGVSGNPDGRPNLPDDLKKARKVNRVELERVLNLFVHMTKDELVAAMNDKATTTFELMVGRIVGEGIKKGDTKHLAFILDRLVGPVKTKVSFEGSEDGKPFSINLGRIEQSDAEDRLKIMASEKQAK